ncbi:MAG: hypothetical protein J6L85_07980 [Clostridia bacterium]|nr:hypothetical protein [Clostridia bacterium]
MKSHNKTSLTRFCAAVCKIMGASVPRCADAPLVGQIFGRNQERDKCDTKGI